MVAGACAVWESLTGVVVETGVAMGVSQPASVRIRLVTRISQKAEERHFKCFILYSFLNMYISIIAITNKKLPRLWGSLVLAERLVHGKSSRIQESYFNVFLLSVWHNLGMSYKTGN
jgi:hypothetical protein